MTKFKVIETRQRVKELDAKKVGKNILGGLQTIVNLAQLLGTKTTLISTLTSFFKNTKEIFKNANTRKYTKNEERVINALKQGSEGGLKVMRKFKKGWNVESSPEEIQMTHEQLQIQNNLINSLNSLNPKTWPIPPTEEQIKQATQQAILNKPEITDDKTLMQDAYDILRKLINPEVSGKQS